MKGLVWRQRGEVVVNPDRPFIADLDDLPMPRYDLLPLDKYRMPLLKGPFCFIVTSRGCPAGCTYCIKHVSYGPTMRLRSAKKLIEEIKELGRLGVHNVHMYADLFTVNKAQVVGLCNEILAQGLKIKWTCNSRVDFVDLEMLQLMAKAGCHFISWGLESGNKEILAHAKKGVDPERAKQSLGLVACGRHPQLGLLHHRAAGRDRRDDQADDRVRQGAAARHRALPHRGAVSRHARSSRRWRRTAGSAKARGGKRWTWTSPRCSTTRTCGLRSSSTGRSARSANGRCGPVRRSRI